MTRRTSIPVLIAAILFVSASCRTTEDDTLFTRLPANETGINFRNLLKEENPDFNIISYPYFYNGGGVAVGDLDNDGLPDIFFTGNMVKNRLFLNQGNLRFKDITTTARIAEKEGWCTGATMADVNADGWLDIYVCRSGLPAVSYRRNLLFINNHDRTFTECAAAYGLDDPGYATQASFFDYDKDGDLDMFLINQSSPEYSQGHVNYLQQRREPVNKTLVNKLYRNDGGRFADVTDEAGIVSNVFTFSLGLSTADINQDGWPDVYVANDFKEHDYCYLNNGDGTFTDAMHRMLDHNSLYSMGVDIADYNNDLLPDIMVPDMLAEGNHAQKMHMGADNFTQYDYLFRNGMYYQYMKNSLQKNNGDGTFSEIGQLAGVSNTDWSWSPLFADYDNDGLKDLFITNGYKRDNTDVQFVAYTMHQSLPAGNGNQSVNVAAYISNMPGIHVSNYIYKNMGDDTFRKMTAAWGLDHPAFSHGAACVDLDGDGDLDLVVNNTDDYADVYRNNTRGDGGHNYLSVQLQGTGGNPQGIGAKVFVYAGQTNIYLEQVPVRGYQSSVDSRLHTGLGSHTRVDSVRVIWPDDGTELITNVQANTTLSLKQTRATARWRYATHAGVPYLEEDNAIDFHHRENYENDFTRQVLLPRFYSHNGPCLAKADVNGDGLDDVFVGGAKGQAGALYYQQKDGAFTKVASPALDHDLASEDVDAVFFDADNDGDQDLYVASGGYEFEDGSPHLQDRLYMNNGAGLFTAGAGCLPQGRFNKSCVRPADIDGDGDTDLFVGGSVMPGNFPFAASSVIYLNDGHGRFSAATGLPDNLGMVSDAAWTDLDSDGHPDLVVASEWRPLKIFLNDGRQWHDASDRFFKRPVAGLWTSLLCADLDGDGDADLIAGNYGLNSQLRADAAHPLQLFAEDIDQNGSVDPVITRYVGEGSHPLVPRDDMIAQVPVLKKKFPAYDSYARAMAGDILPTAVPYAHVDTLATLYFENTGSGFVEKLLPMPVQYAPVYALATADVNSDGITDVILAGNNKYNRIYLGKHDANHGVVLLGNGNGSLTYIPQTRSGLTIRGDVRDIITTGRYIFFAVNNEPVRSVKIIAPVNN